MPAIDLDRVETAQLGVLLAERHRCNLKNYEAGRGKPGGNAQKSGLALHVKTLLKLAENLSRNLGR